MYPTPLFAFVFIAALGTPVLAEDFGDQQIAQMLHDRPSMRDIIPRNHTIYRFVSEHFAGGGLDGARVYWDQTEPIYGAENLCQSACVVRVTQSNEFTGRDKWAMLVFELFNINPGADAELRSRVVRNDISKDDFVMRALALEIEAMRKTQEFLRKHPIPEVAASVDRFYFGLLNTPSTLDEYVRFLDEKKDSLSYDPREYNAEVYESLRPPLPTTQD